MPTLTANEPIVKEIVIAAPPETVWPFFTQAEKLVQWLGRRVEADVRPGGILRLDYDGFDIMRGQVLELVPYERLVWSWGWETLVPDATQPGASRIEFTFRREGANTRLRLVHSGLAERDRADHSGGWDSLLPVMAGLAEGRANPGARAPLSASDELASRLNTALVELRWIVEQCPDDRWQAATSEQWTVAATAHHVLSHLFIARLARSIADGSPLPVAGAEASVLHDGNAQHAREFAAVTRDQTLRELFEAGPEAVRLIRGFRDSDLATAMPLRFLGGAAMSTRDLIGGPMLGGIAEHIASIRAAIG